MTQVNSAQKSLTIIIHPHTHINKEQHMKENYETDTSFLEM